MSNPVETKEFTHATKRCPECYEYMALHATRCPHCNIRLGDVEPHGMAKRRIKWKTYFSALVACAALAAYIYWAFFYEG